MLAPLLTVPEAALPLKLSRRRAYQLAQSGDLPGVRKLGPRSYRVSRAELEAYLGAAVSDPLDTEGAAS
jgi:excisionase family DNA binding protein